MCLHPFVQLHVRQVLAGSGGLVGAETTLAVDVVVEESTAAAVVLGRGEGEHDGSAD